MVVDEGSAGFDKDQTALDGAYSFLLRDRLLVERKLRLRKLLARSDGGLQFVEHLEGDGAAIFAAVCSMGLEGIRLEASR